jgi:hypothetical protein
MAVRVKLRRVALILLVLALLNAPFVLWVLGTNPGLSEPDVSHTFALWDRGGEQHFYTPAVGVYLIVSIVVGGAGLGLLFLLDRVLPERKNP